MSQETSSLIQVAFSDISSEKIIEVTSSKDASFILFKTESGRTFKFTSPKNECLEFFSVKDSILYFKFILENEGIKRFEESIFRSDPNKAFYKIQTNGDGNGFCKHWLAFNYPNNHKAELFEIIE